MKKIFFVLGLSFLVIDLGAQVIRPVKTYDHADTLRGSVTPERAWWNVLHYDLHVQFNPADSSLAGHNVIQYKVLYPWHTMQIDLMQPLAIDSIRQDEKKISYERDGNAFHVHLPAPQRENSIGRITVFYHGKPQVAARPPWQGGVIWARDNQGRPWISVACQGLGASVWYPCKDHQGDEADSAALSITVPPNAIAVANGRLKSTASARGGTTFRWAVTNPINNYNLIPYIGAYANFSEVYKGEKGNLDVGYWVLDYNLEKAHHHLAPEVRRMLKDLEYWFGPYPFYDDGYKIVEASHLGMEHQSAIAYGNGYQYGYRGRDLSGSGWGLKWDFIVVHESAHEWFGNNITTKDVADMWVHESFANYSETLFITSEYGREAGNDYLIGTRKNIRNDIPIIGKYNVNEEGSGDMYSKGGNMLHMIRQIINDDEKFRQLLRGLNQAFYHQTVTTAEIENYISRQAGIAFSKVFDQYLRNTQIPTLVYEVRQEAGSLYLYFHWTDCIAGFDMPVKIQAGDGKTMWLHPGTERRKVKLPGATIPEKIVDRNFYVGEKRSP
jgi:aminopeptidase N